jgi:hypothetical protein
VERQSVQPSCMRRHKGSVARPWGRDTRTELSRPPLAAVALPQLLPLRQADQPAVVTQSKVISKKSAIAKLCFGQSTSDEDPEKLKEVRRLLGQFAD